MNNRNNIFLFLLLQVITVYNATTLGWHVKKTGDNTYEFTIKKATCDMWKINDLGKIIEDIVSYNIIS
jgi:hypothetical protein